jgi:hypothetical protein
MSSGRLPGGAFRWSEGAEAVPPGGSAPERLSCTIQCHVRFEDVRFDDLLTDFEEAPVPWCSARLRNLDAGPLMKRCLSPASRERVKSALTEY